MGCVHLIPSSQLKLLHSIAEAPAEAAAGVETRYHDHDKIIDPVRWH
jgi:hypothetical protein